MRRCRDGVDLMGDAYPMWRERDFIVACDPRRGALPSDPEARPVDPRRRLSGAAGAARLDRSCCTTLGFPLELTEEIPGA